MEKKKPVRTMELLAPAGTLEAFEAAVENRADAVYLGAPDFNARALTRQFSLAEMAAMVDHAHGNRVRVYAAMNSLLRENETQKAVEVLAALEGLGVDALIVQDLGIAHLAARFFPRLRLHASTLMGAHNSLNVRQFADLGFKRVVLARELTLEEIARIHRQCRVELEVFVHGALCFAYSGLCLFSSYLGGKSGLRGRCVQPCRRRYAWAGKGREPTSPAGYLFSMNDLSGIGLLEELRRAGVGSLKIEGRMRSAGYVASVVRAYRLALDNPGDPAALAEARVLLEQAMGRKASSGYFRSARPGDIISPQHSGNIGLFLGKIEKVADNRGRIMVRENIRQGDRLRLHQEGSGERLAFTLKGLWQGKHPREAVEAGNLAQVELPGGAEAGDSLYKVDSSESRRQTARAIQAGRFRGKAAGLVDPQRVSRIMHTLRTPPRRVVPVKARGEERGGGTRPQGRRGVRPVQFPLEWWLRIDDLELLKLPLPATPSRLVVTLCRETMAQLHRHQKRLVVHQRRLVWALPPVILEDDLPFYQEAVNRLRGNGYNAWQIGHIGQLLLFAPAAAGPEAEERPSPRRSGKGGGHSRPGPQRLLLFGDFTLNVLNSLSLKVLADLGFSGGQVALETDRTNIFDFFSHATAMPAGMTVHARPPLFTSRLSSDFFKYDVPLVSPKGEVIFLKQRWGQTLALAGEPFSLLPHLAELAGRGVAYVVVDLSHMRPRAEDLAGIFRQLAGPLRGRKPATFNYMGTLF